LWQTCWVVTFWTLSQQQHLHQQQQQEAWTCSCSLMMHHPLLSSSQQQKPLLMTCWLALACQCRQQLAAAAAVAVAAACLQQQRRWTWVACWAALSRPLLWAAQQQGWAAMDWTCSAGCSSHPQQRWACSQLLRLVVLVAVAVARALLRCGAGSRQIGLVLRAIRSETCWADAAWCAPGVRACWLLVPVAQSCNNRA
jgi:hypothetical protein